MTPNGQSAPSLDKTAIREPLPAGAGRISDVPFQVLKYDVFGDCTVGG
jgi:hypothetical protein